MIVAWEEDDDDYDDDDVDDVFYNRLRCLVLEYVTTDMEIQVNGKTIPIRISTSSNDPIPSQSTARLKI